MILYHGSNIEVREPKLLKIQRDLDFGHGFYTTSDLDQAVAWAKRTARIRQSGKPLVSSYMIDDDLFNHLKVLHFNGPDRKWLNFVAANRRGKPPTRKWDIVIGPVANDQTIQVVVLYLDGYITAREAIRRLLPQKLKDQYVFKTSAALASLTMKEVLSYE